MIRSLFRLLGKSDHRIVAVFAASESAWRDAVAYVRAEIPQFPVWLITTLSRDREGAEPDCERTLRLPPGPALPFRIAALLWPHWVALSVVTCTGDRGFAWMKLAPFLVPPWKLLIMNEHRDFFNGLPFGLLFHGLRRLRDRIATAARSLLDLALGVFWKIVWTLLDPLLALTSRPWLQPQEAAALAPGSADEPYLVFREGSGPADLAPLRALFDRPGTFAAGYQPGRAGFQKDVLPRAAFRQLQPGEAAAVLAPLADVVLVDAAKLARLGGFPRARSRRCQWLLLFWKAACAGWKSYSVGAPAPRLPMIPDRAFAEAEFCYRLLRDRTSTQGGGSWDALRGSIATHPAYTRPLRPGRRRILMVSPYLPFPLSHGGAVRMFNLSRHLSQQFDLLLLSFRERNDSVDYERLSSCFARVVVVDQDERRRRDPTVPDPVAQSRTRAMAAAVREVASEYHPDLLQVEYTQLAGYREVLPDLPAVLVEHDVTFSLHAQLPDRAQYDLWYRYESHWLARYDAVAVMSRPEKDKAVAAGAPESRTWIVPNGVDVEHFQPGPEPEGAPPELLFVGSFRHLPNLLAFQHLQTEIRPLLPGVRLRVVAGPNYKKYWKGSVGPGVTVEGFISDLAPCYARAAVVLVPLTVSAGTNIKVMEAMACGRPVVSTPVGVAGLDLQDGEEVLLANGAEAFAAAVKSLLEDTALRRRLGANARRAAVERFSWERCARRAVEMYETVWSN
jgi:glycosyltransferase involved in cell wall biosynthesis